ncbi:MAG: hypothetical protein ISS14_05100 [Actinobacteria bacterium]|nr:hypothetical protein [Actinomycetota bacterium]
MRLLSLRPGNLLITHKVTLSIDFSNSVTLLAAIQATGLLAFTLTGLTPAEHTSLNWTYKLVRKFATWGSQYERIGSRLEKTLLYSRFSIGFNLKYSFSNAG